MIVRVICSVGIHGSSDAGLHGQDGVEDDVPYTWGCVFQFLCCGREHILPPVGSWKQNSCKKTIFIHSQLLKKKKHKVLLHEPQKRQMIR